MERRKFLALAGSGAISLSFSLFEDSTDYEDSAAGLRDLATRVDEANLADPPQSSQLVRDIEETLKKSKTGLNSGVTKRTRKFAAIRHTIDETLSILPGIAPPPAKPPIENTITAIKAANAYYAVLLDYLRASEELRGELLAIDFGIQDETSGLPTPSTAESVLTAVDTTLATLRNEDDRQSDSSETHRSQMLPNRGDVRQDASRLREVYATYGNVQRDYIRASMLIDEATLQRENQEREDAEHTFAEAASIVESSIPEKLRASSLSVDSIPLDGYHQMLRAYEAGIPFLKRSCKKSPETEKAPNRLFGDGLTHLLRARQVVESR